MEHSRHDVRLTAQKRALAAASRSLHIYLQRCDKRFARDIDLSEPPHAILLAFISASQAKLAFAGNVGAVTFHRDVPARPPRVFRLTIARYCSLC
jgi:hypothetical protein